MTRFLPIPRKDLPHEAVLVRARDDVWEDDPDAAREEITLRHVRLTGADGMAWTLSGERGAGGLTLFYDCVNSKPHGMRFQPGDRLRFEGREYLVGEARALCSDAQNNAVHHWEVALR